MASSDFGFYEKRLLALMCFFSFSCILPPLQPLVTQYEPPHHCKTDDSVYEKINFTRDGNFRDAVLNRTIPWEKLDGKLVRSSCKRYNLSLFPTNTTITEYNTNLSWPDVVSCNSYLFEANEVSAVTEFGMVCEKSWQKPLFISIQMSGMAIGGMLSGILSDRFGRKPMLLCTAFVRFSTAIVTSFSSNLIMYGIMVFLTGITSLVDYLTAFVLTMEFLPSRFRPFYVTINNLSYDSGFFFVSALVYLLPDWRWYLRVVGIIGIVFIPYCWLIDETPYWLVASGKLDKAKALLKKIGKINKQPPKSIDEIRQSGLIEQEGKASFRNIFMGLLKEPTLLFRLFTMMLSWFVICMATYAIIYNANTLSGNRHLVIASYGFAEFASISAYFLLTRTFSHRKTYLIASTSVIFLLLGILLIQDVNETLVTVVVLVAKCCSSVCFASLYGITGELFPTVSRQCACGLSFFCARVGAIIAPYILPVGNEGNAVAASSGTMVTLLVTVILFLFLPETKLKKLPQTTEDALALQLGWQLPCCNKGSKATDEENKAVSTTLL